MSHSKTTNFLLTTAFLAGVLLLISCYYLWSASQAKRKLLLIRGQAQAMFDSTTASERVQHANESVRLAESLRGRSGLSGTTASLYLIGVSKVADYNASGIPIPAVELVEKVPVPDLLLVSKLLYKTSRLGPADQLVTIALNQNAEELRSEVLKLASEIRVEIGRDADVLAHCEEFIKLAPQDPWAYRMIARVHRNHGRWDNYIEAEAKVVELTQGEDYVSHIGLVDGYLHLGRAAEARTELDKILQVHPEIISQAPTLHARMLMQEGNNEQALSILQDYLKIDPADEEALVLVGTLQVSLNQFEEAVKTLQSVINISPAEDQAYYQIGQAYARLGETEKGQTALKKHRMLLDEKVRLFALEQQAAREPYNLKVKKELADSYEKIGMHDLADFWRRSAATLQ